MKTAIVIGTLLLASLVGLAADPVSAEDPTQWCTVHVGDPTPTGVTCGPRGPICGGVVIGGYYYCTP